MKLMNKIFININQAATLPVRPVTGGCFRSLLVSLKSWYDDLAWPYDEDDTILCIR